MAAAYDLVIRGGTIVDGTGGAPYEGDVALADGRIAAIGAVAGSGAEEIAAKGKLVTPGFVDIHTHYDGQATWSSRITPSAAQGVTTVVMGNCGVGFAPCRPKDRHTLIRVMEGVEDIPDIVMEEGIPWTWETYPEYLNVLASGRYDIDIAAQAAHGPFRVFVMGERAVRREPATEDDVKKMAALVREAIAAGALGFSTSRTLVHRLKDGTLGPTYGTEEAELTGLALAVKDAGTGVLQIVDDTLDNDSDVETEYGMWRRIVTRSGRPLSFTMVQSPRQPEKYKQALSYIERMQRDGMVMRGQTAGRPVGLIFGLECSYHPFVSSPSFKPLRNAPLERKVAALRDPDMRARLLQESVEEPNPRRAFQMRNFANMYPLGDPPDYFPPADANLAATAVRRGVSPLELAYDCLLERDGRAMLYNPGGNFYGNKNDVLFEIISHEHTMIGLGDGGAHMGSICDASVAPFLLTYWSRDRAGAKLPLPRVVNMLTEETASYIGLRDRGVVKPGYRADLNVIDYDRLHLHAPQAVYDLPAGGRRLDQRVDGFVATIVNGVVTYRGGRHTGALPGRLVRGAQAAPAAV